ncbi:hemolysin family protein [Actinomyces vulturis]|uniref:hemolysin family protein n=1 Tax=Actinomyces vulturis TaxID=1857645 RepID=UPI00082DC64B|nr:hemolysin family protein [Actinomyces vulturis]
MTPNAPTGLLIVLALITLTQGALLSAVEAALSHMTRAAAEDLVEEQRRNADQVLFLAEHRGPVMASVASVRVFVDMAAAVAVTLAVAGVIDEWWLVLLISLAINALLLGVVVGLSPRSAGRRAPDTTMLWLAPLAMKVYTISAPSRWIQERYGRRASMTDAEAREEVKQDLREMIDEIGEADSIEDEDREMMRSVVELGQTLVREIMVPRTDMVTLDHDCPAQQAMDTFIYSGYSRIPVVGESTDDVRGVLYLKDVLRRLAAHPEQSDREVSAFVRRAMFVPEMKLADDLLRDMQVGRFHMALAVDEYGGIAGLVTMEDLLEEVVGDLTDEHDHAEPEPIFISPGLWEIPARLPIDELGDLFDLEIDDDDVDTAAGLLSKATGRIVGPGDTGDIAGVHLQARAHKARRGEVRTLLASLSEEHDMMSSETSTTVDHD